jgi:hypothetical protein
MTGEEDGLAVVTLPALQRYDLEGAARARWKKDNHPKCT